MFLLRRVLFYLFVFIYCVSCPLIVWYALGYILKPGTEHGIAKTGLIYLSTLPSGAMVHVENKRFSEKTPTMIRGLLPADYRVVVSLKGYRPWARTVSVQAEKATVFDKILLLPREPRREKLSDEEFADLIPIESKRFLLLAKGPLLEDLFFYDLENRTLSPVTPHGFSFGDARLVSYSLVEGSENVLVHAQFGLWWGEEKFFWILPSRKIKIRDVTHLFREKPQLVDWDSRRPTQLFAWTNGVLSRLDLFSGAIYPKFMENVRAYGVSERKLYVVDEDSGFQKMDMDGKNSQLLEESASWAKTFLIDKDVYKIKILPKDHALFLSRGGQLLSDEPPYRLANEGVTGLEADPQSQKILVWGHNKLGIYDFSDESQGDKDFSESAEGVRWIIDKGKKIAQAFWAYDQSHVLFRDDSKVYLLELVENAVPEFREYLEVKKGSSVVYMEKSGKVYYLEKTTGQLYLDELVPKAELLFLKEKSGTHEF